MEKFRNQQIKPKGYWKSQNNRLHFQYLITLLQNHTLTKNELRNLKLKHKEKRIPKNSWKSVQQLVK